MSSFSSHCNSNKFSGLLVIELYGRWFTYPLSSYHAFPYDDPFRRVSAYPEFPFRESNTYVDLNRDQTGRTGRLGSKIADNTFLWRIVKSEWQESTRQRIAISRIYSDGSGGIWVIVRYNDSTLLVTYYNPEGLMGGSDVIVEFWRREQHY